MSDIRKRKGKKGTTYQVRYPSKGSPNGYAYKAFDTLKEARAFLESGNARQSARASASDIRTVAQATDLWLKACEREGINGARTRHGLHAQKLRISRRIHQSLRLGQRHHRRCGPRHRCLSIVVARQGHQPRSGWKSAVIPSFRDEGNGHPWPPFAQSRHRHRYTRGIQISGACGHSDQARRCQTAASRRPARQFQKQADLLGPGGVTDRCSTLP